MTWVWLASLPLWVQTPNTLLTKMCPPPTHKWKLKINKTLVHNLPSRSLQIRQAIVSLSTVLCYSLRCLLVSPVMRSHTGMAKQREGLRHALSASLCPYLALSFVAWLVGSSNQYTLKMERKSVSETLRNVLDRDASLWSIRFYLILSPRKFQDVNDITSV